MGEKNSRCSKIKDLEKRLACLKQKYDQLTNQLEMQRGTSGNDEENIDYQHLLEERRLVEKYMERLSTHLSQTEETIDETTDNDTAVPGRIVLLVNENHRLKLKIVDMIFPEDKDQVSIKSPLGKAVLGRRVGECVIVKTPKGKFHYEIVSIE
jgi:transcription elongation factor GreA